MPASTAIHGPMMLRAASPVRNALETDRMLLHGAVSALDALPIGPWARGLASVSSFATAHRQCERERRTNAHLARDPDPSAVEFDELAAQGQAQSGTLRFLVRCPHLAELLEYHLLSAFWRRQRRSSLTESALGRTGSSLASASMGRRGITRS